VPRDGKNNEVSLIHPEDGGFPPSSSQIWRSLARWSYRNSCSNSDLRQVSRRPRASIPITSQKPLFSFLGIRSKINAVGKVAFGSKLFSMWRTILSLALIGTTLIGPGFCCCSLGLVQLSGLAGTEAADDCCCGSSTESNPCAPLGDGSGHQCPCKKFRQFSSSNSDNERLVLPSETRNRLTSIIVFDAVPTTVWSFEVAGLNVTGSPCCAFPRLDGQGILRAKQALRC
jgi:hypothetical protein